jgi:hypothetical protein
MLLLVVVAVARGLAQLHPALLVSFAAVLARCLRHRYLRRCCQRPALGAQPRQVVGNPAIRGWGWRRWTSALAAGTLMLAAAAAAAAPAAAQLPTATQPMRRRSAAATRRHRSQPRPQHRPRQRHARWPLRRETSVMHCVRALPSAGTLASGHRTQGHGASATAAPLRIAEGRVQLWLTRPPRPVQTLRYAGHRRRRRRCCWVRGQPPPELLK